MTRLVATILPFDFVLSDMIENGGKAIAVGCFMDRKKMVTASFDYFAILRRFKYQDVFTIFEGHNGPVSTGKFLDNDRILSPAII